MLDSASEAPESDAGLIEAASGHLVGDGPVGPAASGGSDAPADDGHSLSPTGEVTDHERCIQARPRQR